jgi:hypothetical protein
MSETQHAQVLEDIKKLLPQLNDSELREFFVYVEGLQAGRRAVTNLSITAKPARKRSACSLCGQSGHRAPNCPQAQKVAVAS